MITNSTIKKDDCIFLLKDLTDIMPSTSLEDKEKLITQGVNYSEMITDETPVSKEMNQIFKNMVQSEKKDLAKLLNLYCVFKYCIYSSKHILSSFIFFAFSAPTYLQCQDSYAIFVISSLSLGYLKTNPYFSAFFPISV